MTGGIAIDSSTINGQILDTGTLSGGIFIDSASLIRDRTNNAAVAVSGSIFSGGIANYGTITSASGSGIVVGGKVTGAATLDQVFRRRHQQCRHGRRQRRCGRR